MKKWLIFTVLKLVEIPILVIVPYQVFMLIEDNPQNYNIFFRWFAGLTVTVVMIAGVAIGACGIWLLILGNMELANYIKCRLNKLRLAKKGAKNV